MFRFIAGVVVGVGATVVADLLMAQRGTSIAEQINKHCPECETKENEIYRQMTNKYDDIQAQIAAAKDQFVNIKSNVAGEVSDVKSHIENAVESIKATVATGADGTGEAVSDTSSDGTDGSTSSDTTPSDSESTSAPTAPTDATAVSAGTVVTPA